jgi:oxygen-dependent protoporphyrinogen oxidase
MEREHGSLIRAMVARRKRGIGAPRLMSFVGGMATLSGAMATRLGGRVRRGAEARRIARVAGRWRVTLASGDVMVADHVVLAVAARAASQIVSDDTALSGALSSIPYSGVQLVAVAYRTADIPRPLDGYGYLVTRGEHLSTLGVVWESSLFPGRAPEGTALLRAFVGGARRPEALRLDDSGVVSLVRGELERVMRVAATPLRTWVFRWPQAIAQYTVGHAGRMATIRAEVARHPGLHVCGTSYEGVALNQAIASGRATARVVAADLATRVATVAVETISGLGARSA